MKTKKFRKMFSITMGLCRADLYMPTHVFNTAQVLGRGHDDIIFKIENGKITGYFSEEVIQYMGEHGLKILTPAFVQKNQIEAKEEGQNLWKYSEHLASLPLKHLPAKELLAHYNQLFKKIQKMFGYFNVSQPCISFAIENEIKKHLAPEIQHQIFKVMLKQDRTTLIEEEEKDLIKIALKIKKDQKINNQLILHQHKYSFLASSENFDEFSLKYFQDRLKELTQKTEEELKQEIIKKTPDPGQLEMERKKIIEKHRLSQKLVHLFDIARIYSHQRMMIRIYWTKAVNTWGKILRELARRMNLSEVQIQYLLRDEINQYFEKKSQINQEEIEKRKEFSIFAVFDRSKPFLLIGQAARDVEKKYLQEKIQDQKKLKGTIANPGLIKGKVKLLAYGKNMVKQIEEMEKGDVLVTGNTRPDMVLALHKASAIVTDEGGICSHAALVSRELGIPCVVGTKDATKVFKDGDLITVDAEKGIIIKH